MVKREGKEIRKPEKSQFQNLLDSFLVEEDIPESLKKSFPAIDIQQRFIPGLCRFAPKKKLSKYSTFRTRANLIQWKPLEGDTTGKFGMGTIQYSNGTLEEKKVFIKTIHLLDPFTFVKGDYGEPNNAWIPNLEDSYEERQKKLNSTYNQAYIDATAQSILSRLKEENITPHALLSYGMVVGVHKSYWYDISNDFESLRSRKWFWDSIGMSGECLRFSMPDGTPISKQLEESLRVQPDELYSYSSDEEATDDEEGAEESEEDADDEESGEDAEESEEDADDEGEDGPLALADAADAEEATDDEGENGPLALADAAEDADSEGEADTENESAYGPLALADALSQISAESIDQPAGPSPTSSSASDGFEEYLNAMQDQGISRQTSYNSTEELEEANSIASFNNDEIIDINRSADDCTVDNKSYPDSLGLRIQIECKNMPVLLLFQEAADGTMDQLLEEEEVAFNSLMTPNSESPTGFSMSDSIENMASLIASEKDSRWAAWLLQIIAGLSQLQALLSFCHNDLHTNNIVWTKTPIEYLYYKRLNGDYYKVPTYGKLFHFIDYGRATFSVGDRMFISDDFFENNDAFGQYNYGACFVPDHPVLYPNPSFDLCRLAASLIDSLYSTTPPSKCKNPPLLSSEGRWKKYVTSSELYNTIWRWLIDDKDKNVLRTSDGDDRFPGFDLYIHIAKYVHSAVPKDQWNFEPFVTFKTTTVHPTAIQVYN